MIKTFTLVSALFCVGTGAMAGYDPPAVEIRMAPGSTVVQQFINLPVEEWPADAIQQHPADYLTACERETKIALQKLGASEISIAQQKTKLEDQRDELAEKLDIGAKDLEKLKAAYNTALPTNAFPIQWEEYQLEKEQTEIQIVKLDAEIQEYTKLFRNLCTGVTDLQYQKEKLYAARAQAQSQLAKIVVNRETLKIKGITSELKDKMLEIKSINNLLSMGGVGTDRSQPVGLNDLTSHHKDGVDKAKLRAILKTKGPVEPAEPVEAVKPIVPSVRVEKAIQPPVAPVVLPAPSGLPTPLLQPQAQSIAKDLSKEEFRQRFASLGGRRGEGSIVSEAQLYNLLGHPDRTQTVDITSYWYWVCKDGKMQLVIHGYKNAAIEATIGDGQLSVEQVNDY